MPVDWLSGMAETEPRPACRRIACVGRHVQGGLGSNAAAASLPPPPPAEDWRALDGWAQHAADEIKERGFAVVRRLLPRAHLDELCAAMDGFIATVVPPLEVGVGDGHRLYETAAGEVGALALKYVSYRAFSHLPDEPQFDALLTLPHHPALEAVARACLNTPAGSERALTFATKWLNKPPVALEARRATPMHQDAQYFARAPNAELPRLCSVWIALDPADEENGCLRYIPFSHRSGLLPHTPGGPVGFSQQLESSSLLQDNMPWMEEEEELAVLQPGDAVWHDGCTVHGASANQSAHRQRRALGVTFRSVSRSRNVQNDMDR